VRARLERYRETLKQDAAASSVVPLILEGRVPEAADRARSEAEKQAEPVLGDFAGESPGRLPDDLAAWLAFESGYKLQEAAERASDNTEAARLFQAAAKQYADTVGLNPNHSEALCNWGVVLFRQGKKSANGAEAEAFFQAADEKFFQALQIKPDDYEILSNCGALLTERGKRVSGLEAAAFFDAAAEKFVEALRIKPNYHEALYNWGGQLLERGKRAEGSAAAAFFEEAARLLSEAAKLNPGETYNLACLAALQGDVAACEHHLKTAEAAGKLPALDHLLEDRDLDPVRETAWFRAMLERLRQKRAA